MKDGDGYPFDPSHPDALALYCSDGRFTDAVEALLRSLGYPRLDTLTIPGGPALLEMMSTDHSSLTALRRSLSFLVVAHKIKHVVLVAHEGCGYYKSRFSYEAKEALTKRQHADLRSAAAWIRAQHPDAEVVTYYAHTTRVVAHDGAHASRVRFDRTT